MVSGRMHAFIYNTEQELIPLIGTFDSRWVSDYFFLAIYTLVSSSSSLTVRTNREDKCDDRDPCTVDSVDATGNCLNEPVVCPSRELKCDPIGGGVCREQDLLTPCIAVIDETDTLSDSTNEQRWTRFRQLYPTRQFCLLQPFPSNFGDLYVPKAFETDPYATFVRVNRDNGDPSLASGWFEDCGLSILASSGIDFVGLFIDESGSMNGATIQASYDKFVARLSAASLTYCRVSDRGENWIAPFSTSLSSQEGGGTCY